ncbi:MAG: D-glycero-beta-D-manno-heptose-7-phosphate kinase, partial [Planctomycetota bacterium]|nr:D-glycero-beta-D-manno-heptose-7-phosphate kinase [Planctomycetota bacterium]
MNERELIRALGALGAPRIAVVGDFMLDRYLWGDATRVSPEAPVPVVHARREEDRPGGAGNVALNLAAMGAHALCFGAIGSDRDGETLVHLLAEAGTEASGMQICGDRPTVQKIRVLARNQQMLRVDREEVRPLESEAEARLLAALCAATWDALVLSDYGKGVLTPNVIEAALAEARRRGAPSVVDPKHRHLGRYRGATLVTPNRAEAEAAAGELLPDREALALVGERLRRESGLEMLLVTLGADGMFLLGEGRAPFHLPTAARQVFDVTGAGDTVVAMLAAALAALLDAETAVRLANCAAGVAVAKVGTAAVGRDEVLHALHAEGATHKTIATDAFAALQAAAAAWRREGLRVVFTNGCFDLLHAGHVRYLQEARRQGDVLVIGLNDDESVRRLKGPERPFNPLEDRAEVLAALACVDLVAPFSEDTPERLVRELGPDVLVKGSDWEGKDVAGADAVRARGGVVRFVEL